MRLKILGERDEQLRRQAPQLGDFGDLVASEVREAIRTDDERGVAKEIVLEGVRDDDVLELQLEGGIRQWVRADQFRTDLGAATQRGAEPDLLIVPRELGGGDSRGKGKWVLKALKVLGIDPAEAASELLVETLEGRSVPHPGLYRCPDPNELGEPGDIPDSDEVALVFLHGTASSTSGSFGDLTRQRREIWDEIRARYGERIFALEHHTLSLSPIQNAVQVAAALPEGARLHLVSHSRGGLVGELLCRAESGGREPFDEVDRGIFERGAKARDRDLEALAELNRLLRQKRPRIERFLRVACPARGTTLASRRLDRYLSALMNALGLVPGLEGNPIYDFLAALTLAVVEQRTEPEQMPGLEAMMPGSPLVRLLNRPDRPVASDLSVISGDIEASGVFNRLKVWATDLFYLEDHDLVVNTQAMYGGAPREKPGRVAFFQEPEVSHFTYFGRKPSAGRLKSALLEKGDEIAGFDRFEVGEPEVITEPQRSRDLEDPPVVLVLPGVMGSTLSVDGNLIWLDLSDLAKGRFTRLDIEASGVAPGGLLRRSYGDLLGFLSLSHKAVPFAYDWRRSIFEEGRRLADAIATELSSTEKPVRILAHSMGGLVARAMILERPEVWQEMKDRPGCRFVMLGTPNRGSYVPPRVLTGHEKIIRRLALLDLVHRKRVLIEIASRFPGLLELFPTDTEHDFFSADEWAEIGATRGRHWRPPSAADLELGRRNRARLDESPIDPERMLYVAGHAPATPIDHEVVAANGRRKLRFLWTEQGDGRVSWRSGPPEGVRVWYVGAVHGKLADHRPAFAGLLELLDKGDTDKLSSEPPPLSRSAGEIFELPEDEVQMFPDLADLEGAALGYEPELERKEVVETTRISVVHADLTSIQHPVAVSHYEDDVVVGSEAVLDRCLDGALRRRCDAGKYPGRFMESVVVLRPQSRPEGGVVVGLGRPGRLSPGALRDTFAQAALDYAFTVREEQERHPELGAEQQSLTLATLLIGSGEGGLSIRDSVRSLVQGVVQANAALRRVRLTGLVRIAHLVFVELYEDRAVAAARALGALETDAQLKASITVDPWVRHERGGRRQLAPGIDRDWWTRLQIRSEEDGSLRFLALTSGAGVEETLVRTQRRLIDGFVSRAVSSPRHGDRIGRTLFELLVPNRLKDAAPGERSLVLVIDESSASYPWELMDDHSRGQEEPLALRAGMVRQLIRQDSRGTVREAMKDRALVVGEPALGVSRFPPLPGARKEAHAVYEMLQKAGFDRNVPELIGAEAEEIVSALFDGEYRVLHLAGHGVYEPAVDGGSDGPLAGMVIGDGIYLTPGEVQQMRRVPELVFINCCHLGKIESGVESRFHELAGNLGTQLIDKGARTVIAAGWAVQDSAAETFARTFYRGMLSGETFGEAVLLARRETRKEHQDVNTWAAYQCYGDPGYRLREVRAGGRSRPEAPFVSSQEAIFEIGNLLAAARVSRGGAKAWLPDALARVDVRIRAEWRSDSALLDALGHAYGEAGLFEKAIQSYEAALQVEDARYSAHAIEQLANLQARWAVELQRETDAEKRRGKPAPNALVRLSIQRLEHLVGLAPTAERYSLLGSSYRRRAWLLRLNRRQLRSLRRAVRKMADAYRQAHELKFAQGRLDSYAFLNWAAARGLLSWLEDEDDQLADIRGLLDRCRAEAEERARKRANFWDDVVVPDSLVAQHLATGALAEHRDEIVEAYLRARRRGASPRQFQSVLDHLDILAAILEQPGGAKRRWQRRQALAAILREMRETLARHGDS